jgi:hypothetical protein
MQPNETKFASYGIFPWLLEDEGKYCVHFGKAYAARSASGLP